MVKLYLKKSLVILLLCTKLLGYLVCSMTEIVKYVTINLKPTRKVCTLPT